ncbi:uncharacterized protein LOC130778067 [Actinidia eriantha]|uniref:uncharacterized protein LOC130778067 n=1 Tax=Actinidia eriantha TaxID=165200 RepID=UPI002586502F|nr:uncharacterized protein LOC130778067 [Actinidia eriantha]
MMMIHQGLVVDGGGEKKGIVGMVVGIVGIEGIVVGRLGSEVAGNGGSVTFGITGMVGNVGIWVLGKSGSAVDFCRVCGVVGGRGVLGNGGNVVALGNVGITGSGGSVTCKRWRAATDGLLPQRDNAMATERSRNYNGNRMMTSQGLVVDGGGERRGIVGIVVGMVGIEGIVVGRLGSEVAGSGGIVTIGTVGMVGIWVLGNGGNVGFSRVGSVGKRALGSGGNVAALGNVGIAGNGGRDGITG